MQQGCQGVRHGLGRTRMKLLLLLRIVRRTTSCAGTDGTSATKRGRRRHADSILGSRIVNVVTIGARRARNRRCRKRILSYSILRCSSSTRSRKDHRLVVVKVVVIVVHKSTTTGTPKTGRVITGTHRGERGTHIGVRRY